MSVLSGKRILLIVGGGIAAYKCLDLIRRLREQGAAVTPVMTGAAAEFVTPLSVGALAASRVYSDLFDREDEQDVGHIRLAREHDLVLLAPATADRMARVANGLAEDLAGAILLATRAPVLMAPAMNPAMWDHPATRRNHRRLLDDGIGFVGPGSGEMAEKGEAGTGRMAEPLEIVAAAEALLAPRKRPLTGLSAIVTSGPTHEPIDPVRYIANRSSGRQGHAIAEALRDAGARVTLVSGPVTLADPRDVAVRHVETAAEMLIAVEAALPADIAVFVAAVADWRVAAESSRKIKKTGDGPPALALAENPDILSTIGHHDRRPGLVIGFAAETDDLLANARGKLARKGADAILANDVSPGAGAGGGVMGGTENTIRLVTAEGVEEWPTLAKEAAATRLAEWIAARLGRTETA
ncbi:bifunctional phosphopantothenoylcysteine decarboxylase/phosphopantothenate--cysteine ligase CoaBC [Aurantimonas sp. 22II-16-19i]|uniref:bifunctional phosphopantothenoylcysteine decarboxylase/phosphopantothenate--cysteine ligase CoaBC n=1 Tax=Aurantimonas sp. 22II-16-19i TaxID=1317114 RepID=UPI0009F7ABFC|nr:bifunctional phosphopantothenoylcysteine decarboxylase/phosphopantothenate--cysteine ligase CoaBC [Aurantimonas sp. 22II-16-19i]ORE92809.1 bifunctional phosphopantothenoylcysteine decarboxylase/phosphopantothenate synthase [Aurantimonas sp. 22II-16-19i]